MPSRRLLTARRGFSLIELITVVTIIGVVIAILVPALGGADNIARRTASQALMNNVVQASLSFENDTRRPPGYFSATDMGFIQNRDRGFTAMENVMLDLAGGVLGTSDSVGSLEDGWLEVGPSDDREIVVNPSLIGADAGGGGYFTPPADRFTVGEEGNGNGQVGEADHLELPDLVDNFGQPILAWVRDPVAKARGVPTGRNQFAQQDYDPMGTGIAYYYWNSNAGFLRSQALGEKTEDQSASLLFRIDDDGSAPLGPGSERSATEKSEALAALLGNPSFASAGDSTVLDAPIGDIFPAASRGSIVLHSAGSDGVYLDSRDSGAKATRGRLLYGLNIKLDNGSLYTDAQGRETNIDIVEGFDDVVVSGGG